MLINWFSLNAGCTSPTANQVAKLPPSGGRLNDPLCEMVAHGPKPARLIVVTTDAVGCIAEILGTIPPPHLGSDCSVVAVVTLRGGDNYCPRAQTRGGLSSGPRGFPGRIWSE